MSKNDVGGLTNSFGSYKSTKTSLEIIINYVNIRCEASTTVQIANCKRTFFKMVPKWLKPAFAMLSKSKRFYFNKVLMN